jgi:hypothetical protein
VGGTVFLNWVTLLSSLDPEIGSEKVADAILGELTSLLSGFSLVSTARNAVDLHGAGTNALSTDVGIQKYIIRTRRIEDMCDALGKKSPSKIEVVEDSDG